MVTKEKKPESKSERLTIPSRLVTNKKHAWRKFCTTGRTGRGRLHRAGALCRKMKPPALAGRREKSQGTACVGDLLFCVWRIAPTRVTRRAVGPERLLFSPECLQAVTSRGSGMAEATTAPSITAAGTGTHSPERHGRLDLVCVDIDGARALQAILPDAGQTAEILAVTEQTGRAE